MIGHWFTLLLAGAASQPEPEPEYEPMLASADDSVARAEEDEMFQLALALITSGVLECH